MAKIAVNFERGPERESASESPLSRRLASGNGWTVRDVVCTAGPHDHPFEEQHAQTSIAIVLGGTFQYRSTTGHEMMTPGCLLLGNAGDSFTCGHEHGAGDRCVAFSYEAEFFETWLEPGGGSRPRFGVPRLPPMRALAPLVAKASMSLSGADSLEWEELSVQVAVEAIRMARGAEASPSGRAPSSLARVTRVVRLIENEGDVPQDVRSLARVARLSPYHFLRTFEELTGTTPHQYLLRLRLRRAAVRLRSEPMRISDIALDCGFGDISNFNRTFRAEFGVNPRAYRSTAGTRQAAARRSIMAA